MERRVDGGLSAIAFVSLPLRRMGTVERVEED